MKHILRRILPLLLALSLVFGTAISASAATTGAQTAADILYTLDLASGGRTGMELDRTPTRAEALALILRITGHEREIADGDWSAPFFDVQSWAVPYVGYAYEAGIFTGYADGTSRAADAVSANDFLTMLLRAMGYDDPADFTWQTANLLANRLGLTTKIYTAFTRGDMMEIALQTLTSHTDGLSRPLINLLTAVGAVDSAKANAVGLGNTTTLTARQTADRCASAVFYLQIFTSHEDYENSVPAAGASGFFLTADGIAVTNYHAIKGATDAVITLKSGEQYPVESVIWYDAGIDMALLKIGADSLAGQTATAFPYLTYVSSDSVSNGDTCYAISCPLGLQNSISDGIVSSVNRMTSAFTVPIIQNTAPISYGSSGGALFNTYGQVIGVTSAYFVYGQSLYMAVPLDVLHTVDWHAAPKTLEQVAALQAAADKAAAAAAAEEAAQQEE
ncbi:MAG: trypsin-like peptidase domain-containing protein [Oscillospiraceae bacterium]|nr:trypsin-like peptidase domain-containing protein [Oscillospiraceae bacterium]